MPLVLFKLLPRCWSSEGLSMSKYVCGYLRGTAWNSSFFHWFNPHWFVATRSYGDLSSCTGTLVWGSWCGVGTPHSWDTPPEFLSTTCGCGTSDSTSLPLPTVWIDVVSLILWLSDFHSTQLLSVLSDGFSIFSCNFNMVVQRGEPCLPTCHLDWKSCMHILNKFSLFLWQSNGVIRSALCREVILKQEVVSLH